MSADVNSGLSDSVSSFLTKADFFEEVSVTDFSTTSALPDSADTLSNAVVLIERTFFLDWF